MALIELKVPQQQHLQQQTHAYASGSTISDHQNTPPTGCTTSFIHPSSVLPILLDLFKLDERSQLPKTGVATMSRNGKNPKVDLRLNLSPPRTSHHQVGNSPHRSATVSPTSPPSSCVSSENNDENVRYSNSPEATSMVLAGCPGCLIYVMLSEEDPKCPRCKQTVSLDFLKDKTNNHNSSRKNSRKN